MVETCEVEGCLQLIKYGLYKLNPDGSKAWIRVCARHEGEIGDNNMRLQGYNPGTREKLKVKR